MPILGQRASFTVLNVLGSGFMGGRFVPDSLDVGTQNIEYYQVPTHLFFHLKIVFSYS